VASFAAGIATAREAPSGMSFHEALSLRKSTRSFRPESVEDEQLLELVAAANGINRPDIGGRTAPSWHGAKDIDIYVATAKGTSLFDAEAGELVTVEGEDIRTRTSAEPFVGTAPAVLIYVSDTSLLQEAAKTFEVGLPEADVTLQHTIAAYVNTAVIAQNVYLFCAATGLGTCLVGGSDPVAIAQALKLDAEKRVTYVQPVGHPSAEG
jgi:nitroreductase